MSSASSYHNRIRQRVGFALLVALVVVGLGLSAVGAENGPTFRQVVEQNFAKWDQNHDGTLSATEIDSLVKDPKVTGAEAAAVAAIHRYLRGAKAPSTVTTTDLYNQSAEASGRRDQDDYRPRFASDYASFRRHLLQAPHSIFDDSEDLTIEGIRQGRLGDCFFVSTLGALIEREPQAIHEMLQVHKDGSIDVTFPGADTVRVKPMTDAEIALTSTAGKQGVWINVLERALAEVMFKSAKSRRMTNDIELDVISRSGSTRRAINVLTGHGAKLILIRNKKTILEPPPADELPALRRRFHPLLVRGLEDGRLMCAFTPKTGKLPPGMATHHEYAILDYDAATETVYLWNPWGHRFQPKKAPEGIENGYHVQGGKFQMPLDEFLMVFGGLHIETWNAAPTI
jgi:hypothetical protein